MEAIDKITETHNLVVAIDFGTARKIVTKYLLTSTRNWVRLRLDVKQRQNHCQSTLALLPWLLHKDSYPTFTKQERSIICGTNNLY
jgi:hypothetical protein